MDSLIVSFNAIVPTFLMIAVGMFVKRIGILQDDSLPQINNLVFRVLLPQMLFMNIYTSDIRSAFSPSLLLTTFGIIMAMYGLTFFFVVMTQRDNARRGAMIQAIFRSNFVILGLPVVSSIYGNGELGTASLVITMVVPVFNILAVVTLEIFRGGKPDAKKIALGIVKNPLIIAAMSALLLLFLGVKLPTFMTSVLSGLGAAATPIALLVLGAGFHFSSIGKNSKAIIICTVGRLIAIPAFCLSVAILFGIRGVDLAVLLAVFASPTAVTSYTMAQQMGSDAKLAGEAVVVSSALACITMFLWTFGLIELGFL